MANPQPTWSQVARRPKWVGAFVVATIFALVCGFLAVWQGSRSFYTYVTIEQMTVARELDAVATAGQEALPGAVGSLVRVELEPDYKNSYIVANRNQQKKGKGYWVISNAHTRAGNSITVALGYSKDWQDAKKARKQLADSAANPGFATYEGWLMPSEAPVMVDPENPYRLKSLSLGQLVNLYVEPNPAVKSYPLFLLVTNPAPPVAELSKIAIKQPSPEIHVNWLSAFYTVEWAVFAGFAFFLWWRLVRDEQQREIAGEDDDAV